MMKALKLLTSLFIILSFIPSNASAQVKLYKKCLLCHGRPGFKKVMPGGKVLELYVNKEELENSIHNKLHCTDCHADVMEIPHLKKPGTVNCFRCHYKDNPDNAIPANDYFQSIHGELLNKGDPSAPKCQNCHGGHNVQKVNSPLSTVNHRDVAYTCGKCHKTQYKRYVESIHGVAVLDKNIKSAPTCTTCHGKHLILAKYDPLSNIYPTHVLNICSKCHENKELIKKYNIPGGRVSTYKESYHGVADEFGSVRVANCASCHRAHLILPASDPRSSINKANLVKTCGRCHPNANIDFTKGKIHVNYKSKSSGIIYYIGLFFEILTISTLTVLFIHILFDLYRRYKAGELGKKNKSGE
ncbi:MAG: hypothetical protein M1381_04065 [Deltaproteobacteria bacterium]|nr:hypothetical protein [Deltaproteobacteria bacterium]MCL5792781.1 hypothetical protein [Deltaproteobacteria bacterium]